MDTHFLRHGPRVAATLRKRLWQGGIALALFLGTLLVGNFFIRPERAVGAKMIGHDFLAFYSAGTFARRGEFEKLYDLDAVQRFEHQTAAGAGLEIGSSFGPYWNPPFYAWVFAPISALPYQRAWILWELINFTALAGAIVLLARMLPKNDWRTWGLVPLAIIASMPFIQAATHAQNTFTSLLILSAAVTFWRQRRAMLAGAVCGLLFYKPQLAAVVGAVMVLTLGWRALAGLATTGAALLAITVLTMPGTASAYLHQLPLNVHFMQVENPYLWERHVTLKAFWRLLLQGRAAGEASRMVTALSVIFCVMTGGMLLWIAIREARKMAGFGRASTPALLQPWQTGMSAPPESSTRPLPQPWQTGMSAPPSWQLDRVIAATVAAMPLLMPFYFDYDLMLLAVPAVLIAGEMMQRERDTIDRWIVGALVALDLWLFINPGIAAATHVGLTVPLLVAVTGLLMRRCFLPVRTAVAIAEEMSLSAAA